MQHAPRGTHVSFPHTVPAPFHVPLSATQLACVRTEQLFVPAAVVMQHAPVGVGGGQVFWLQTVPAPRHEPPEVEHCCSLTTAHQSAMFPV